MNCPKWLHYFAVFTSAATVFLLAAGALVTGTNSGLAVPDWPLSFGQFFPPMVGGVFYEHGHRLVAGTVALLTVGLAVSVHKFEKRLWVRWIALLMVVLVLAQALLGGLTVLLKLPPEVSVSHACLGQIFFCSTVVLALVTSESWQRVTLSEQCLEKGSFGFYQQCFLTAFLFFAQLLLGATMRHLGAGSAILDFPTSNGFWIPPLVSLEVSVHYLHRVGAVTVTILSLILMIRIFTSKINSTLLSFWVGVLVMCVSVQFFLGALTIWLGRPVALTTLHLVVGALCLASSVALTAITFKLRRPAASSSELEMGLSPA